MCKRGVHTKRKWASGRIADVIAVMGLISRVYGRSMGRSWLCGQNTRLGVPPLLALLYGDKKERTTVKLLAKEFVGDYGKQNKV